eukprot:14958048-Heterocapsa_arctica.AAC.1
MRQGGHRQSAQQVRRHPEREPPVPRRVSPSRLRHGCHRRRLQGRPCAGKLTANRQRVRVPHRAL